MKAILILIIMCVTGCYSASYSDTDTDACTATDTGIDTDTDTVADTDTDTDTGAVCWTNPDTGLCWENATIANVTFDDAMQYCASIGDGWRMPNIAELIHIIKGCPQNETDGECEILHPTCVDPECYENCTTCPPGNGLYVDSGPNVSESVFWSVSRDSNSNVLFMDFSEGKISLAFSFSLESTIMNVKCVR